MRQKGSGNESQGSGKNFPSAIIIDFTAARKRLERRQREREADWLEHVTQKLCALTPPENERFFLETVSRLQVERFKQSIRVVVTGLGISLVLIGLMLVAFR